MQTIKTRIHTYAFNTHDPQAREEYKALCAKLRQDKDRRFFNVLEIERKDRLKFDSPDIELETDFVWADQWNTACGKRVFDWYEGIIPGGSNYYKQGHYLDITEEMREARANQLVCGYCGARYWKQDNPPVFCTRCLDSEYLKETEVYLLRLMPAGLHFPTRAPLTETEQAELLPQYVARQTTGKDSRAVQRKARVRQSVIDKYQKHSHAVETEYKGFMWLLDHAVNTENCIYYSHTGKFSFGWRQPVSASVKSALLDILVEFPFEYEIKSE
jgi:hypothetical protein